MPAIGPFSVPFNREHLHKPPGLVNRGGRRVKTVAQKAGVDHSARFARMPRIDQKGTGACHAIAFAEVFSVVAGDDLRGVFGPEFRLLSPGQLFLDHFVSPGRDRVIREHGDFVAAAAMECRMSDACRISKMDLHWQGQGGRTAENIQLLQRVGGVPRFDPLSSFDEANDLFDALLDTKADLIFANGDECLPPVIPALREGGLDAILERGFAPGDDRGPEIMEQRQVIRAIAAQYEVRTRELTDLYTDYAHCVRIPVPSGREREQGVVDELKDRLLVDLRQNPLILSLSGHALILTGWDDETGCFSLRDSSRAGADHLVTPRDLLAQGPAAFYTISKAAP